MKFCQILCCLSFLTRINSTVTKDESVNLKTESPPPNGQSEILDKTKADGKTLEKQEPSNMDDFFVLTKTKLDNIIAS